MRLLVVALLIGCGDPVLHADMVGAQPHDTRTRVQGAVVTSVERVHMHRRFDDLQLLEHALISGRLVEAQALAFLLARAPEPWMAPWPDDTLAVERAALAVALAPSLDDATRREPKLAMACAQCHRDARALPFHRTPEPLPASITARHRWAVDQVREGMVHAIDASWQRGIEELAATPPPSQAEPSKGAVRLRALARTEVLAPAADRSAVYGELLVTCSACHATRR
jgi:hypothetical protein